MQLPKIDTIEMPDAVLPEVSFPPGELGVQDFWNNVYFGPVVPSPEATLPGVTTSITTIDTSVTPGPMATISTGIPTHYVMPVFTGVMLFEQVDFGGSGA